MTAPASQAVRAWRIPSRLGPASLHPYLGPRARTPSKILLPQRAGQAESGSVTQDKATAQLTQLHNEKKSARQPQSKAEQLQEPGAVRFEEHEDYEEYSEQATAGGSAIPRPLPPGTPQPRSWSNTSASALSSRRGSTPCRTTAHPPANDRSCGARARGPAQRKRPETRPPAIFGPADASLVLRGPRARYPPRTPSHPKPASSPPHCRDLHRLPAARPTSPRSGYPPCRGPA